MKSFLGDCALIFIGALMAFVFLLWVTKLAAGDERSECQRLAPKYGAKVEARLWDRTRVDLLTPTHAIEADWPEKWAEAIGQALYYSQLTGKRPGVILLVKDAVRQARYIYRCQTVCARTGITLFIEHVEPGPQQPPAVPPPGVLPEPAPLPRQLPVKPGPDEVYTDNHRGPPRSLAT